MPFGSQGRVIANSKRFAILAHPQGIVGFEECPLLDNSRVDMLIPLPGLLPPSVLGGETANFLGSLQEGVLKVGPGRFNWRNVLVQNRVRNFGPENSRKPAADSRVTEFPSPESRSEFPLPVLGYE